jgi:hypothetical protein
MAAGVIERVMTAVAGLRQQQQARMAAIQADENKRFQAAIKKYNRKGGELSTAEDPTITARVAAANRDHERAHRSLVEKETAALRGEHDELLRAVDMTGEAHNTALDRLDRFERTALQLGVHMRTLGEADCRDADWRHQQWKLKAWPPVRPVVADDDED